MFRILRADIILLSSRWSVLPRLIGRNQCRPTAPPKEGVKKQCHRIKCYDNVVCMYNNTQVIAYLTASNSTRAQWSLTTGAPPSDATPEIAGSVITNWRVDRDNSVWTPCGQKNCARERLQITESGLRPLGVDYSADSVSTCAWNTNNFI